MIDSRALAEYSRNQTAKDRNYVGLLLWAAARVAEPPPAAPTDEWIRLRLVAERIPLQPDFYTIRTLAYFIQDPATQAEVHALTRSENEEGTEDMLNALVQETIAAFMPRFAVTEIPGPQVSQWRIDHPV